ncbi:HlyC/CorC family transporter [bacterium]|nr:MAG: HlyC/CorC family transporter [bacterium]
MGWCRINEPLLRETYAGVWAVVAIFALLVLNALLKAAKAGLYALRPHHVRVLRDTDPRRANRLQRLLEDRDANIAASGLASRLIRIALVLLILLLAPGVGIWLADRMGDPVFTYGHALFAVVLMGLPLALLNFGIGEVLPRAFGSANPVIVLGRLTRLVRAISVTLAVPARGLVSIYDRFASRFGTNGDASNELEEEIKTLAESGEEAGQIESDERELIHSVFEFAETVAREIMTPRVHLDAVSVKSDPSDVVRVIEETGHSRIPLYDETDDDILGVVHAKDLLGAMAQGRNVELRRLLRPVLMVPEGKNVRDLLAEMRAARTQMAIVQDEFGGTAGVVTIEDIVEELVGDIVDEYDPEESEVVDVEGGWLVDGKTHIDDLNDRIGSEFESEEFDTVGGFVFGHFGRQPKEGESIDVDRYRFTVTDTDGRRVSLLRIERVAEPSLKELDED